MCKNKLKRAETQALATLKYLYKKFKQLLNMVPLGKRLQIYCKNSKIPFLFRNVLSVWHISLPLMLSDGMQIHLLVLVFEENFEYRLWGRKRHTFAKLKLSAKAHSFGELKLPSSQATLFSRCRFEKY